MQIMYKIWPKIMMTSSNGNIFRVTCHFCGEFTGHWWIPLTKASDAELWCLLWSAFTVDFIIVRLLILDAILPIIMSLYCEENTTKGIGCKRCKSHKKNWQKECTCVVTWSHRHRTLLKPTWQARNRRNISSKRRNVRQWSKPFLV